MDNRDSDRFGHGPSVLEYATLERLLDGDDHDDVASPWGRIAAVLSTVRGPITFLELAGEEEALARFRTAVRGSRPPGRGRALAARMGGAVGCVSLGLLSAGAAAAAMGALPPPHPAGNGALFAGRVTVPIFAAIGTLLRP
jgi:hypothetical protein